MQIEFTPVARKDLEFWLSSGRKPIVNKLIRAIAENPTSGIGKPEQLKYNFSQYWSRRINREHRLVYRIEHEKILIFSLKGHYIYLQFKDTNYLVCDLMIQVNV